MSSSAAIVLSYQLVRTFNSCGIATTTLFVYDYILCLGREYQYVWKSGKSKASRFLYFYIRYMSLLHFTMALSTISPVSNTSCTFLIWSGVGVELLNLVGPAVLTALRTYVLSGKNKLLGGAALASGLTPFLVNAIIAYQTPPANLAPPQNCIQVYTGSVALNVGLSVCSRTCAIIADFIAIVVTWRATRASRLVLRDTFRQPSLEHVMWTNGNIYFFTLLFINLLDLILVALSISVETNEESFVTIFLDPISATLSCHLLLDLYETNAQLERGGSSLSLSHTNLSLHFMGIEGTVAPEDSPFLSSLAGSIQHSFADPTTNLDVVEDEPRRAVSAM
ncbi:hypothetical protein BC628DRAFT_1397099 [Trametes gibbosa]|nr:hypothetical protein BC628DRAFT_1397099 [Trametes gibbosa]